MVKLKMFRGRWLIILDHSLVNLPFTNFHMDFTTRLCVVNFSIKQLTSDEQMCFNASRFELNFEKTELNISSWFVDFKNIKITGFLNVLYLNVTWHWVCLVDGNVTPSPSLHLDWVAIFKVPFTGIFSHSLMYRETILSMMLSIHLFDILVIVKCQLIFDNVHSW